MDVFDAVRTLLAVRQYKPDPVLDEVLCNRPAQRLQLDAAMNQNLLGGGHRIALIDGQLIAQLG